jgi:hypothetical protein
MLKAFTQRSRICFLPLRRRRKLSFKNQVLVSEISHPVGKHELWTKIRTFWDVALCSLIGIDRRFRGAYCLHHQDYELPLLLNSGFSNESYRTLVNTLSSYSGVPGLKSGPRDRLS